MAARFTLDCATEFLFGHDVRSLSSSIPYPRNSAHFRREAQSNLDSSQKFANALAQSQIVLLQRARFVDVWPLFEMREDKLQPHLQEVHALIDPIVKRAIEEKRNRIAVGETSKVEEETLLSDLVNSTEGMCHFMSFCISSNFF